MIAESHYGDIGECCSPKECTISLDYNLGPFCCAVSPCVQLLPSNALLGSHTVHTMSIGPCQLLPASMPHARGLSV